MQRRVAICGAPAVGKTTILAQLTTLTHAEVPFAKSTELERIVWNDLPDPEGRTTVMTVSGTFIYTESKVLSWFLKDIHAVVYVFGVIPSDTDQKRYPGSRDDQARTQEFFWDLYTQQASSLGSLWTSIPWIFVLNKIDLGHYNPLFRRLPAQFHDELIRCSAVDAIGIDQLWSRIQQVKRTKP